MINFLKRLFGKKQPIVKPERSRQTTGYSPITPEISSVSSLSTSGHYLAVDSANLLDPLNSLEADQNPTVIESVPEETRRNEYSEPSQIDDCSSQPDSTSTYESSQDSTSFDSGSFDSGSSYSND